MKSLLWMSRIGSVLMAGLALSSSISPALAQSRREVASLAAETCPISPNAQQYDVIVFGDEVPGVMTALKLQQLLSQRDSNAQVALITEGNIRNGIGGHLVRGGLAYLDRNQVPARLRSRYGTFGQPTPLYQSFLDLGQVDTIALDRSTTARNFAAALNQAGVAVVGNTTLEAVANAGNRVCSLTAGGRTYTASHFVDASQGGELAMFSGVEMMQGLEAIGLPESALSLGLIMDFHGVTIDQFRNMEAELIYRFFDRSDTSAQRWLTVASGGDPQKREALLAELIDHERRPKLLYQGTADSADVRSLALSILVHGYVGESFDLQSSGFLFDRANIAIFNDRLSFNALLFYANSETAQQLSNNGARPTAEMLAIAAEVKELFEKIGVPRVEIMDELYVRNAGQIANPVDELSATLMAAGGVPTDEALGTFGYHLDDRGGIEGLDERVEETVLRFFNFEQMPVFNYGFRHTLPQERENLAVLGPASGFGGLGTTAGRIVEFNVGVGEGLAIAITQSIAQNRSLQTITNTEVRRRLGRTPVTYGFRTDSFRAISSLEQRFRRFTYERDYLAQAQAFLDAGNMIEAERVLARVLVLNPRNPDALRLRGQVRSELGNQSQARSDLQQALEIFQSQGDTEGIELARAGLEALSN